MSENHEKLTRIEQALADLERADRAGTFRPTPLDTKALLDTTHDPKTPWIFRYRKVAVAATILLATGVWVTMFAMQIGDVQSVKLTHAKQQTEMLAAISIQECIAGPQYALSSVCKAYDVDADGDVDLADISSFQLAQNQ